MARQLASLLGAVLTFGLVCAPAPAVDLVRAGKPVATVVSDAGMRAAPVKGGKKRAEDVPDEALATRLLVEWVKKITGAELPVSGKAPADGPAIYVGKA